MPKISVIVPVYNGQATLGRLLESIKNQTFDDFRVAVIDNASEDETASIANQFAQDDPRFIYLRNTENIGFWRSYLRGFFLSMDSRYMVYLSAGDTIRPHYFQKCAAALEADPRAVLAYSYCQMTDEQGRAMGQVVGDLFALTEKSAADRYMTIITQLGLCTAFYGLIRMDVYSRLFSFMQVPCAAHDNLLLAALALDGPFVEIAEPLFVRQWSDSSNDAGYKDRYVRLSNMSKSGMNFSHLVFFDHIMAHIYLLTTKAVDLPPGELAELIRATEKVLHGRYQEQLDESLDIFIEAVTSGNVYQNLAGEKMGVQVGDNKIQDAFVMSNLSGTLERFQWLIAPDRPKFNYTRAVIYLLLGRREEALAALERELRLNPTDRTAFELKAQLMKTIDGGRS